MQGGLLTIARLFSAASLCFTGSKNTCCWYSVCFEYCAICYKYSESLCSHSVPPSLSADRVPQYDDVTKTIYADSELCSNFSTFSARLALGFVECFLLHEDVTLWCIPAGVRTNRCVAVYNEILIQYNKVSLGTRISVAIGDVIVLLVTWSKTAWSHRQAQHLRIKAPLITLLFRDGE